MKRFSAIALALLLAGAAWGETYYVAVDGDAGNPGTLAEPWTLAKANTTLAAGDTVYIRGGTYSGITGSAIDPTNTGTAGNIITYSSYNGEDVQLEGSGTSSFAVDLDSEYGTVRSYIKVHDLHFTGFMQHLWIRKGTHNEISYCTFIGYPAGAAQEDFDGTWSASYIYRQAQYNWIHHSTFGLWGYNAVYGYDTGVVFQLGLETSATDATKYNVVENCEMYSGGHHVVSLNGSYNVYRNNYFHNEPWYPIGSPVYATRTMFQTGSDGDGVYNLVEGNRIGYGGPKNKDEIGGAGGTISSQYNIWRKNVFLQIYTDGMWVTKYAGQNEVMNNHIYNNTYWHGGYGRWQYYPSGDEPSANWSDSYTHAIDVAEDDGADVHDNVFKNNLFYQSSDLYGTAYSIIEHNTHQAPTHQVLANNWLDNAGDPKLVSLAGTPDPTDDNQFDFRLQSDSPCIDNGGFLATITSDNGTGTEFVVDDAGYFFYPYGGMDSEIPGATIVGDTIQLEGQTATAMITAIEYSTNTITVDTPLTWTTGQGVSLPYNGSAPDQGAYEYEQPAGGFLIGG